MKTCPEIGREVEVVHALDGVTPARTIADGEIWPYSRGTRGRVVGVAYRYDQLVEIEFEPAQVNQPLSASHRRILIYWPRLEYLGTASLGFCRAVVGL